MSVVQLLKYPFYRGAASSKRQNARVENADERQFACFAIDFIFNKKKKKKKKAHTDTCFACFD
jgi:hypothetical protein